MKRLIVATLFFSIAIVGGACELQKSENILSPSIAGPIPGVEISAPKILEPAAGWQISGAQQPITLLLENASSNSPRPMNYSFEVAADAGFATKVFVAEGVQPGDNGRTALRLPNSLTPGRVYYWRAKAQDGANTGPYSAPAAFNLFTPLSFDPPVPVSPVGNTKVDDLSPEFRWLNAPRAGTPTSVGYVLEISTSASFGSRLAAWQINETPGSDTKFESVIGLPGDQQIYWRVRAFEGGTVGPWSATALFRTPAPVVVPPPSGGGTPGGACNGSLPINIIECRRDQFPAHMSHGQLVSFLRAVAIDLNKAGIGGGPFGLLRKENGDNCGGFSCDILCAGSGQSQKQWDVLGDSDGAQTPAWIGPKVYPNIRVDSCVAP